MYFVEREPGNLAVYDSAAELSRAIREGAVGPQSRIFHRTSSQWLSITKHPVYRKAQTPVESDPLPPLGRRTWTFLPAPATSAHPAEGTPAHAGGHRNGRKESSPAIAAVGTALTADSPELAAANAQRRWLPRSLRKAMTGMFSWGPAKTS